MTDIGQRIDALDLTLFDAIPSQSSEGDRRAWLAIQRVLRAHGGYHYLEIGSHLGGSIQQHLPDPMCRTIVSIDRRPPSQPDDRGTVYEYADNSTQRMIENLRAIAPQALAKLACFDEDARDVDRVRLPAAPDLCFIDGEHTRAAVLADFEFCLGVCSPDGVICFHDDWIVYRALKDVVSRLRADGVRFIARKFRGATFTIFLGHCVIARDPYVIRHSISGTLWLRWASVVHWVRTKGRPAAGRVARKLGLRRRRSSGAIARAQRSDPRNEKGGAGAPPFDRRVRTGPGTEKRGPETED